LAEETPLLIVRVFAVRGQTRGTLAETTGIAKGTLLFCRLGLTNVREEARMGCPALGKVLAGFLEAELAVDGETDIGGVIVFLAVVLPPADRAQLQGAGCFQGSVSAAGATIASCSRLRFHRGWTRKGADEITRRDNF
jgi:hypothetical protein